MRILDGELTTVGADCPCPSSSMTWDNQLEILLNVPATQAVVSKITFLQATAPVKLGVVVALKDVATRETTRQVEGLWDSPFCAPPSIRRCLGKRVAEPRWKSELSKISPRQLVEQAALEISLDLQQTEFSADMDVACTGGKSTQCTPPALPTTPFPNSDR